MSQMSRDVVPRPPTGTGPAGRRLWRAVLGEYELAEHEKQLLRQACRAADVCDELSAAAAEGGPVVTSRLGEQRVNPALVELRQQQLVLARLVVALRVPLGDQGAAAGPSGARSQRRALRGVYGYGGVS